jgi:hypothetical protein
VSPPSKPVVRIIEFGTVRLAGPFERHVDPNSATGFTSSGPGNSVFLKRTTEIPATQGVAFGMRYRIEGIPGGESMTVEEILRHPPLTRPDGKIITEERTPVRTAPEKGVIDQKFLYNLSEPYEVVPGKWSLVVAIDGVEEIEQNFTLAPPK